ncbi:hypothetical protein A2526_04225 [candidate division WOR-1 bacterium RIFOXYD2_FULL_36_8]|uniref:Uncharacterized protein TP-0789 domain-containing protein n=1 Tax=candidate division WOR-1 bacterium RIFOXYB2_FULL_36_35 TaxID=1802578 RepID=A0A1F4S150_UNCSA|nr:MAG: hypothetical protein A2230_03455 [candidate division WOR-1 bacterium RIFOXYA2_FULL_36_21]OGC14154.1 MAG: hypothetical protein A2290_00565 [candidate division WOR-1 bacterium RIFOXYB2_FULL_36_35]OGC15376.1 MAG: hypothetical protein A2282_01555 [candidate division WOR-1 bacterium RIFOXYA12_FULL_36_13]OGC40082.1 MAG: hypothetical protein A2526_04225 [candidate division WOR-1 bacterium RIFOXYD2_FULL_36_8]
MKRIFSCLLFFLFFTSVVFAAPSAQDIISKIRQNQDKIKDMSAKVVTIIKSDKEGKALEQKGVILTKGKDKVRIMMETPMRQLTITNGNKMYIENKDTGQKFVQDLQKIREKTGQKNIGGDPLDQTKILDTFYLSLEEKGIFKKSYIITGVPKDTNSLFGKVKFYVDASSYVPTKLEVYDTDNKLLTKSEVEYKKIGDIWVLSQNKSWLNVPGGKMDVVMKLEDIRVNKGIPDSEFVIKEE